MIAVLFEVTPAPGQKQQYLDIAAELRPLLERIDGFLSVERFQSLADEGRLLSLSFWRDEAAITKWRQLEQHRFAQSKGRAGLFETYRLRVADVTRDYGLLERDEVPSDSAQHHTTDGSKPD